MKYPKVFWFSLLAIGFVILAFLVNWLFLIGAVILVLINQKELLKKSRKD
jgi:predicted RND superfamily exporter protein